jgi:hypothetical protein
MTRAASLPIWLLLFIANDVTARRLQSLPWIIPDGSEAATLPPVISPDTGAIGDQPVPVDLAQVGLEQQQADDPLEEYGDFYIPASYEATDDLGQPNCGISMNASRTGCNRLIAKSRNLTCECYNFCNGELAECYKFGETPKTLPCEIQESVLGCRVNFTPPVYQETGPQPCPKGFMCSRDSEQLCEVIRAIPLRVGLGDVHAGMYCP